MDKDANGVARKMESVNEAQDGSRLCVTVRQKNKGECKLTMFSGGVVSVV